MLSIWKYDSIIQEELDVLIKEKLDVLIKEKEAREAIDLTNVSVRQDQEGDTMGNDTHAHTGTYQTLGTSYNGLVPNESKPNELDSKKSDSKTYVVDQVV